MERTTTNEACGEFAQGAIVRLFRTWSASRAAAVADLPRMAAMAVPLGLPPGTVPAAANLFELMEMHLGRALVPECCCSRVFSADEYALIGVIAIAPPPGPVGAPDDPTCGLPGAIALAAQAVRETISRRSRGPAMAYVSGPPSQALAFG